MLGKDNYNDTQSPEADNNQHVVRIWTSAYEENLQIGRMDGRGERST